MRTSTDIQINANDNFRYDGIMSKNAIAFRHQFGDDGYIINDILYFIAFKYQTNPFGYRQLSFFEQTEEDEKFSIFKFSITEFCNTIGYKKNNFREIHSQPQYLIDHFGKKFLNEIELVDKKSEAELIESVGNADSDEKLNIYNLRKKAKWRVIEKFKKNYNGNVHWDTVIANAIYRASTEKFKFRFEIDDKDVYSEAVGGLELMRAAIKHDYKESKKETFFTFYINRDFEQNLNKYFVTTNIDHIKKLKKPKLIYLYDYVLYLRKVAKGIKKDHITSEIKLLSEMAEINAANIRSIKHKLIEKFKNMTTLTGLDASLEWVVGSPKSKFAYKPVIVFHDLSDVKGIITKAFEDRLQHELIEFYRDKYRDKNWNNYSEQNSFLRWMKNSDYDIKQKYSIFEKIHLEIIGNKPDIILIQDYFKAVL